MKMPPGLAGVSVYGIRQPPHLLTIGVASAATTGLATYHACLQGTARGRDNAYVALM